MNRKTAAGVILVIALPFLSVFPALLLVLFGVSGPVSAMLIGSRTDAEGLLRACRNGCLLLCVFMVIGVLLTVLSTVFSVRKLASSEHGREFVMMPVKLGAIILLLEILLFGAILVEGPVLSVIAGAQADIRQIQSGELETETMWMYPGSAPAHLPGPYSARQPAPLTKYYAAGPSLESWDPYLFPNELGFAPKANQVYTTSKSLEWNEENVPRYEITYTSRLRFVVEVSPVPANG